MKNQIIVHCKKHFKGSIDIRDYVVKEAIDNGIPVIVTCGSLPGKSIYTPEELANPSSTSGPFTAKFGTVKEYKLLSYPWKDN